MTAGDRTERRLWSAAGAYLAAIYLGLYPLQFVLDFLRRHNLLRLSIALAFAVSVVALAELGRRSHWLRAQWLVAGIGIATTCLAALRLEVVQERLHLVEYGLLGLMLWVIVLRREEGSARSWRLGAAGRVALAALLVGCAGWIDEGIQALLPNRVYDLGDVGINAGAGLLAACFAEIHRSAGKMGRSRR